MIPPDRLSFVYAIQAGDDGPIKIGWAFDPRFRLAELQTGNAAELRIIGVVEADRMLERALHVRLRPYRLRGEWFKACPEVFEALRDEGFGNGRSDLRLLVTDRNGKRCDNCSTLLTHEDGFSTCAACEEFASLRASGVDPFEEAA